MRPFYEAFPLSSSRAAFAPTFSDHVEDVVLAADTLTRVAIPANSQFVLFSFDGDVRVKLGGASATFVLPSAATSDGSGSELNPAARRLPPLLPDNTQPSHILLRAAGACKGSLAFYA